MEFILEDRKLVIQNLSKKDIETLFSVIDGYLLLNWSFEEKESALRLRRDIQFLSEHVRCEGVYNSNIALVICHLCGREVPETESFLFYYGEASSITVVACSDCSIIYGGDGKNIKKFHLNYTGREVYDKRNNKK